MDSSSPMREEASHRSGPWSHVGQHQAIHDTLNQRPDEESSYQYTRSYSQQPLHPQEHLTSSNALFSAAETLPEPHRSQWSQFFCSPGATFESFASIISLLEGDEEERQIYQKLRTSPHDIRRILFIAGCFSHLDSSVLPLIDNLESQDSRQSLGRRLKLAVFNNNPAVASIANSPPRQRRASVGGLFPPVPEERSSGSPGSNSSSRSPRSSQSSQRLFCPAVDCTHKLEGFSKLGYLKNHVSLQHPTFIHDNPQWEGSIVTSDETELHRQQSRKRKKTEFRDTGNNSDDSINGTGSIFTDQWGDSTQRAVSPAPSMVELTSNNDGRNASRSRVLQLTTAPVPTAVPSVRDRGGSMDPFRTETDDLSYGGVTSTPTINVTFADSLGSPSRHRRPDDERVSSSGTQNSDDVFQGWDNEYSQNTWLPVLDTPRRPTSHVKPYSRPPSPNHMPGG